MGGNGTTIVILGFGKIGQAFGAYILRAGYSVMAIDRDATLTEFFRNGDYRSDEPGVAGLLTEAYSSGTLTVQTDAQEAGTPAAVIVTIPFSITEEKVPDAGSFINGVRSILPLLQGNMPLVIETSVPVGFCRNQLLPALSGDGKVHGRDYLLAHSPERIKSGTMLGQLDSVPKVIGGIDALATATVHRIYEGIFPKGNVSVLPGIESAEMVKMAGMLYRDVNIALANQLAVFAGVSGVDLVSLLPLINSDAEARLLQPGIGVGGHCTPVYPYFMIDAFRRAGLEFPLAGEARKQNEGMALYAAGIVQDFIGGTPGTGIKHVTVLGLAFRPGVKEDAFSPAYILVRQLETLGYRVLVHDPLYTAAELEARGFTATDNPYAEGSVAVVLVTMHSFYLSLDMDKLASAGVKLLVDGRNSIDPATVQAAGIVYRGIGR